MCGPCIRPLTLDRAASAATVGNQLDRASHADAPGPGAGRSLRKRLIAVVGQFSQSRIEQGWIGSRAATNDERRVFRRAAGSECDVITRGACALLSDLRSKLERHIGQYNEKPGFANWKYFSPSRKSLPILLIIVLLASCPISLRQ